jgi:hypothetical protein
VTRVAVTTGAADNYVSGCAMPQAKEIVARFRLEEKADVKLSFDQQSGDHVFGLYQAGIGESCDANPLDCFDSKSASSGTFAIKALGPGEYYLVVESFAAGLEGQVKLTLNTGAEQKPEICNNGLDDDQDGALDCEDLDCALEPSCLSTLCQVDVNLGALILDGPKKTVVVDTSSADDDQQVMCGAGGGKDRVIRFVMPKAGGLDLEIKQSGWHVFSRHRDLGPGTTCSAGQGSCVDSNHSPAFILESSTIEKGVYYLVVEALKPGEEGTVQIAFSAFSPRGPELCSNQVDDDGDGFVDCLDADCIGTTSCPQNICIPDYKVGPLSPGAAASTLTIKVQGAHNDDQTVSCAQGGGKDAVVEVELSTVSALAVECNQSGDHVLGLFAAAQSRDACDASALGCADPSTGAIGCSFMWPNLQPGKYYVIVEAFKAGAEGTMTLTLAAKPDHALEICDNGIDDDGDGLTDCLDFNCAQSPACFGTTCVPDKSLGLVVKGGAKKSVALTTSGAIDKSKTSCAKGGGAEQVIALTLAEPSLLQLNYAQFGNHVVALFQDKGQGTACDAHPIACSNTLGQALGQVAFGGLSAGQYFLVVEADQPGLEGSAIFDVLGL